MPALLRSSDGKTVLARIFATAYQCTFDFAPVSSNEQMRATASACTFCFEQVNLGKVSKIESLLAAATLEVLVSPQCHLAKTRVRFQGSTSESMHEQFIFGCVRNAYRACER